MKRYILMSLLVVTLFSCEKDAVVEEKEETVTPEAKREVQVEATATVVNVTPTTALDAAFWTGIQTMLQSNHVDVVFADGTYNISSTITLSNIGSATKRLQLKANTVGAAVLTGSIAKLMSLNNCQNILIHRLKFTGAVSEYALVIQRSPNITIAYCRFENMPNLYYGAVGAHYPTSNNIIIRQSQFSNVGIGSTAHMIYGAFGVKRLKVIENTFTDCSGSFIRFRGDNSTHGVVYGNTFNSTGTYMVNGAGVNPIFVEVPVFNDINPGDETFGTSFMVTKNNFNYATIGNQSTRFALAFHHSGFNPVGRTHLISAADAATLGTGTVAEKRAMMSGKLGLDGTKILFGGNNNVNLSTNVVYRCWSAYDGVVAPWTGVVSIGSAVTSTGLATTYDAALVFYDNLY
ncbi:right-handed parallel beta-helix repeat-containing protein [Pedobacter xixiisoli]|uniref:Right handed beta helix region n=1 Tax=Pedobacter xixiisoli TaxID=1476464 RepID=A0A285ZZ15_9SPHI|nr:right-handed parallel beta-helix repeat-containing protein [Pedobacter xixiisoli]SOD14898.1 hypothetical protein SAMN06297358_1862 [Pedobacter xixiisoli]